MKTNDTFSLAMFTSLVMALTAALGCLYLVWNAWTDARLVVKEQDAEIVALHSKISQMKEIKP